VIVYKEFLTFEMYTYLLTITVESKLPQFLHSTVNGDLFCGA